MRVVGLTGGIGSGKSTVAALLRDRGVPVVDADAVARACTDRADVLAAIRDRFGRDVLDAEGRLDRAALARIVFADPAARRDLEALTHPCIRAGIAAGLAELGGRVPPPRIVVVEHPLLLETDAVDRVDTVVVVDAPLELRVARTVAGRGLAEADVRARAASQVGDDVRRAAADHVIGNTGDRAELAAAVDALLGVLGVAEAGSAPRAAGPV